MHRNWTDKTKGIGILLLRLFIGTRLIYGVMDNVLEWDHIIKFSGFLKLYNFPFPLASAVVSVYAQLLAGILFITGWKIRIAAVLMIINFLIAAVMVHKSDTFEVMTPSLAILFSSLLFFFEGAGRYSIDHALKMKGGSKFSE